MIILDKFGWNFDNSYKKLSKRLYRKIKVNPVDSPKLVIFNNELAEKLGLNIEEFNSEFGLAILSGSEMPDNAASIAQAYMGHQFGYPVILGDGRAVMIGEQITPEQERFDVQLKGSGPTPFSRGGDGRASIGPMMREYLISESLNALNIPTTRSLAVVLTGEKVFRNKVEDGAVLTRVAKSHLRVGTFELANRMEDEELLRSLANYAIERHFSEISESKDKYEKFYYEVCKSQAKLIAKWMLVGFVHGVMNTDNMSISGEGIDYGPCAFIDEYDVNKVFSSIDHGGRYAYGNQGKIGAWNLNILGKALSPLFNQGDVLEKGLDLYLASFKNEYFNGLGRKLGLEILKDTDYALINGFLMFLDKNNLDYTNSFLDLTFENLDKEVYKSDFFVSWYGKWKKRLCDENKSEKEIQKLMKENNPSIIPRNYWVQRAIDEVEMGKYELYFDLLEKLQTPFVHDDSKEKYKKIEKMPNYCTYCGT